MRKFPNQAVHWQQQNRTHLITPAACSNFQKKSRSFRLPKELKRISENATPVGDVKAAITHG
jgi:hypothetical protein